MGKQSKPKYGSHRNDKYITISRSKRRRKDKSYLHTIYITLTTYLVFQILQMSKECLDEMELKRLNWGYISNSSTQKLEEKLITLLPIVRGNIQSMLTEKGFETDFGYTTLILWKRKISPNACYKKAFQSPAYYYGDIDPDAEKIDNEFFLMQSADDKEKRAEKYIRR
eukprot:131893_1